MAKLCNTRLSQHRIDYPEWLKICAAHEQFVQFSNKINQITSEEIYQMVVDMQSLLDALEYSLSSQDIQPDAWLYNHMTKLLH